MKSDWKLLCSLWIFPFMPACTRRLLKISMKFGWTCLGLDYAHHCLMLPTFSLWRHLLYPTNRKISYHNHHHHMIYHYHHTTISWTTKQQPRPPRSLIIWSANAISGILAKLGFILQTRLPTHPKVIRKPLDCQSVYRIILFFKATK